MIKNIYKKLSGKGLSRWFPTNYFAHKAVRNMTGDVTAQVQGFEMIVPVEQDHGMVLYLKGIYEPAVTKFIKFFLQPGMTFVDVGACLGYYSLLATQIVGESGRVVAFEPNTANWKYLYQNYKLNGLDTMSILKLAASDKEDKVLLNISDHHIGCHSLLRSELSGHGDTTEHVYSVRLDKALDHIDIIKIDVEGWEYYVLKGMESLFADPNNNIIVFMEYCPALLKENPQLWGNLMEFLDRYAYKMAIIDELTQALRWVDIEDLYDHDDRLNLMMWT